MSVERPGAWTRFMAEARARMAEGVPLESSGTLTRLTGLVLEAVGLRVPVGAQCMVGMPGQAPVLAEVVGFSGERTFLMPAGDTHGLCSGARVLPCAPDMPGPVWGEPSRPIRRTGVLRLPMGNGLLGRVVDAQGLPLDHRGPVQDTVLAPMARDRINAMERDPVRQPLDTGVRAINALLTVGRGQRLGLLAGSGVGKSVLLGMMARYTGADVIVVGLIGERGREVKEFVEDILGADGRARSVVVAAPADAPPLLRMQGASYATAVAEHFRDQGRHVLLLLDSLTRYAMAQREIALAIGEPPATKGYPPSCFARLPQLVERSGNGLQGQGSITAFHTVLTEGDDPHDPVADAARAILDGHIVLSRALAEAGHFPAIDIEQSSSRVMHRLVPDRHLELARRFRALYSRYQKGRDLLQVGAYASGSDPALDEAIRLQPQMAQFLQQDLHQAATLEQSVAALAAALDPCRPGDV
ncbi:flagellar protein export ATPase FliI [Verminephrobacter eiseniae]|uniref:Flagellum-specific ATP synthase n=1 Tax=Verminephrobacter eiseniae (strain EF01-2) TaxID=391735 RepID=A1WGY3_VEREI|nr:flagellar protein export ATPase FliI [Verminephrobacter eiseniae]ABM56890.1 flagellar protein export ATPase FliI [Verminephrobacter eiseniae EF01-2]MCW5287236.1 flagellar protein export ATPase FliI [Verminephrobacter eiseniae]MCW5305535.1 flagellar protein export ATPase FliI [Verminephrobacter eiseniae]MCW8191430.1 flagellar protein export ATPase FliI [Verminephrobacter eiseniae]